MKQNLNFPLLFSKQQHIYSFPFIYFLKGSLQKKCNCIYCFNDNTNCNHFDFIIITYINKNMNSVFIPISGWLMFIKLPLKFETKYRCPNRLTPVAPITSSYLSYCNCDNELVMGACD